MSEARLKFVDLSAETYGKYQFCTKHSDGLWYANSDMHFGRPKRRSLPSPQQDTPEKTELARDMHEMAAGKATEQAILRAKGGIPMNTRHHERYGALVFILAAIVLVLWMIGVV